MAKALLSGTLLLLLSALGCSPNGPQSPAQLCQSFNLCVDCEATCRRMLQCRVGFSEGGPPPPGAEDTEQARCERGCFNTDTITPARERCILASDPANAQRCHDEILACLGVDGGPGY